MASQKVHGIQSISFIWFFIQLNEMLFFQIHPKQGSSIQVVAYNQSIERLDAASRLNTHQGFDPSQHRAARCTSSRVSFL